MNNKSLDFWWKLRKKILWFWNKTNPSIPLRHLIDCNRKSVKRVCIERHMIMKFIEIYLPSGNALPLGMPNWIGPRFAAAPAFRTCWRPRCNSASRCFAHFAHFPVAVGIVSLPLRHSPLRDLRSCNPPHGVAARDSVAWQT